MCIPAMNGEETRVRVDKWLWAARFFKTRSRAKEAVVGGKVHIDGERVKPARSIHRGQTLTITLPSHQVVVVVKELLDQRGPARVAQTMYEETESSIAKRTEQAEQRKAARAGLVFSQRKPSRADRRKLAQLKQRGYQE